MIKARDINYKIGRATILHNLNVNIKNGKITTILGSNGAGKSTLLKILTGLVKTNCGEVKIDDVAIEKYSLKELAKKRAVLSQNSTINFPFSALDVVLMGSDAQNNRQTAHDILELVDALHLTKRSFPTLSGGEQQRIHLARVLLQIWHQENSYLFLDEPTSALDLKHQHQLLQLLRKLITQKNISVISIMHDLHLAAQYSDEILMMKSGEVLQQGKTKEILNSKMIAKVYDVDEQLIKLP